MIEYRFNPDLSFVREGYKGNPLYKGRFLYREDDLRLTQISVSTLIKWFVSKNPQREEKKKSTYALECIENPTLPERNYLCWLGHSSFLINLGGVTLLLDPVLYDIPFYKRYCKTPIEAADLPKLDYLLISHSHYDHLDKSTLSKIPNHQDIQMLVPLGVGRHLDGYNYQEAGWYQCYQLQHPELTIVYLPAKHWTRRHLFDTNKDLWGSFLIFSKECAIFFAGDTAYEPELFAEISETISSLVGSLDLALLPIGAYKPQYIMKPSHTTPKESWQILEALGAQYMLPMHYGTYDLSDEPLGEPIQRYRDLRDSRGLELKVGEVMSLSSIKESSAR